MSPDSPDLPSNGMADAEPKAERASTPIVLIILFALLVYWAMAYLDSHAGGFNPMVYLPYPDYAKLDASQPVGDPTQELIKAGALVFSHNCAVCHQETGIGSTANGCPPLVSSEWVVGGGPNRIVRLVLYGGTGPISVLGQQYPGTTQMTPFRDTLNDHDIAAALSYVRNTWGNKASVVAPEKVTEIRNKEKAAGFTGYRSAPELLKIPDKD